MDLILYMIVKMHDTFLQKFQLQLDDHLRLQIELLPLCEDLRMS